MTLFTDLAWPFLLLVAVSTCRAEENECVPYGIGPNPALKLKKVEPPYIKTYDYPKKAYHLGNLYVGNYADLDSVAASSRLRINAIANVVIPEGLAMRCWSWGDFSGSEYNLKWPGGDLTSTDGMDDWDSCKVYPLDGYYVDIYHGYSFEPSTYGASDLASASFYKDDCSDIPSYGTGTQVVTWEAPWFTGEQREYSLGDYSPLPIQNSVDSVSIPLGLTVHAFTEPGFLTKASFFNWGWVSSFIPGGTAYQLDNLGVNDWDSIRVERAGWCIFNSQRKDVCGVKGHPDADGTADGTAEGEIFTDPGCHHNYCETCPLKSVRLLGEAPQATILGLKVLSSGIVANCGDEGADSVTLSVSRAKSFTETTSITVESIETKSWDTSHSTGVTISVESEFKVPFAKSKNTFTGSYDYETSTGGKTSLKNSKTSDLSTTIEEGTNTAISVPVNFASLLMITSTEYEMQSAEVSAEYTYQCTGEEPQQEMGNSSILIEANRWDSPTVRPVTKSFPSAEKCLEVRDGCLNQISHAGVLATALEMEATFLACFETGGLEFSGTAGTLGQVSLASFAISSGFAVLFGMFR